MPPQLNRGERLQIMLSDAELGVIDDWRFKRRMPSRASAIRELLRLGLASEGVSFAEPGAKSSGFGVISPKVPARRKRGPAKDTPISNEE